LKNRQLVEEILKDLFPQAEVYKRETLLANTSDRIIEPTFDEPEEHLEFLAGFCFYNPFTDIGTETYTMFFKHKEVTKKFKDLSEFVQIVVKGSENPQKIVESYIELSGYEYICLKFLTYWLEEKKAGRIDR
jgi:hypothetical protein